MKGRASKIEWIEAKYLRLDLKTQRAEGAYDPEDFNDIVDSIKNYGYKIEHPLVVRLDPEKGKPYYVVSGGHNRFEAGLKAGNAGNAGNVRKFPSDSPCPYMVNR